MRSKLFYLGCLSVLLLCGAEQHFWDKQEAAEWTPEQVTQFTSVSPWAKQVTAVLTSNDSNMAGSSRGVGSSRRGGGMISSRGGSSSSSSSGPSMPKWQAQVRWVSAKPMQQVLKLHLPENFKGRYVVSVTGLPIGGDTARMAEQTTLLVKRGDPVNPETAYQDPADTSTVYFAFLPSTIDVSDAKTAVFDMVAAPFEVKVKFNVSEMKYLGEPSF